jgi:hypothetical protein
LYVVLFSIFLYFNFWLPLGFSDPQVPKIESVEFKTNDISSFHSIDENDNSNIYIYCFQVFFKDNALSPI